MSVTAGWKSRGFWLRHVRMWHWVSSALCLAGMLLFSVTGITLNHAGAIGASAEVTELEAALPPALRQELGALEMEGRGPVPEALADWLSEELSLDVSGRTAEFSPIDIYIALPRPGGDGWVSADLETGAVFYEATDRGWIAYLNDLHKGRDTGAVWGWFIDIFAAASIVFCLTGFFLLYTYAPMRPRTWPAVGAGFLIPVLLALFFIH